MKASVLYYSKTGTTKKMAEKIAEGMEDQGVETKTFSIEDADKDWANTGSPESWAGPCRLRHLPLE